MATEIINIGSNENDDYQSLAVAEAALFGDLTAIRCGCNKKLAELKEGHILEIRCGRCKVKNEYDVQKFQKKE